MKHFFLLLIFLKISCPGHTQSPSLLVGKWICYDSASAVIFEFKEDSKFSVNFYSHTEMPINSAIGRYEFNANSEPKVLITSSTSMGIDMTTRYRVKFISEDILEMQVSDIEVSTSPRIKYHRIK